MSTTEEEGSLSVIDADSSHKYESDCFQQSEKFQDELMPLPTKDTKHQEEVQRGPYCGRVKFWIVICTLLIAGIAGIGLATSPSDAASNQNHDVSPENPPGLSPSNDSSSTLSPSASPMIPLDSSHGPTKLPSDAPVYYDPPSAEDCEAVSNGDTKMARQENLLLRSFTVSMDIALADDIDRDDVIQELEDKMQAILMPIIVGCNTATIRRNIRALSLKATGRDHRQLQLSPYSIANAQADVQLDHTTCTTSDYSNCIVAIINLDLYLKGPEIHQDLMDMLSSVFGPEEGIIEILEMSHSLVGLVMRSVESKEEALLLPSVQPSVSPMIVTSTTPSTTVGTSAPNAFSTAMPSSTPSVIPTITDSSSPTFAPVGWPTTGAPTRQPSTAPSKTPSRVPAKVPTITPTRVTTLQPSISPTMLASSNPTTAPVVWPTTAEPTMEPTLVPSKDPTISPSSKPTVTPSRNPTVMPTRTPTPPPTPVPTTPFPTATPSLHPTPIPTLPPTPPPTMLPTHSPPPTTSPTKSPTTPPTPNPTPFPTVEPPPTLPPTPPPTRPPTPPPTRPPTRPPTAPPTEQEDDDLLDDEIHDDALGDDEVEEDDNIAGDDDDVAGI